MPRYPCGQIVHSHRVGVRVPKRWEVYLVRAGGRNRFKVGFTNNIGHRLSVIQTGNCDEVTWFGLSNGFED